MKKSIFLILLAAISLFSCVKPEFDNPVEEALEYNATLTASVPETKVAIADDNIKLSWNKGDKISVLTSKGVYKTFIYDGESGASSAEFKGLLDEDETVGNYAVYPANPQHAINDGVPSINLPSEYTWNENEVMEPMVAVVNEGEAMFMHAGGLFAFDVKNIPAGTKGFKFDTSAKLITGTFEYSDNVISAVDSEEGSHVTFGFDALQQVGDMKFYIPVPVGNYADFTVSYISSDNSVNAIRSSSSKNVIASATVKLFTVKANSDSYYVTPNGSVDMDGLSWTTATTFENALSLAVDGDVIHLAAGTYKPQNVLDYNGAPEEEGFKNFLIDKNITLIGGYPEVPSAGAVADASVNKTILDGDTKAYHTLIVAAPITADKKVMINGITVKGGNASNSSVSVTMNGNTLNGGQGGGIALLGTSAELNNVIISNNTAGGAGGVFSAASKVKMTGCTVSANKVAGGNAGGIWFSSGSDVTMDGCTISNNEAVNAGGLYLYTASGKSFSAVIKNTSITENKATTNYGGAWLRDDSAKNLMQISFDGCTFYGNSAIMGSAVYNLNVSSKYSSCVFSENKNTSGNGVVVFYENCISVLDKCTIKNNSFVSGGAGIIFVYTNNKNTNPKLTITNSSLVNNTAKGNTGALWLRGDNGKVTCNCVNNTFCGNTATREGAVFAYKTAEAVNLISNTFTGNKGYAININTSSVNSYNNIISGNTDNKDITGTVTHKCSIVGSNYYDADGSTSQVTPAWSVSTMLGSLNASGVCPLLLTENPARTYGMSSSQLQALANDYVSAEILSKDQLGNTRTGNVIGAYAGN